MFGMLTSTDFDQGTLEYVENPDPVAAVSRNLRDKVHVSCMFCRARKVRCSGGQRCQRCLAMGLECVYPESHGRSKRPDKGNGRRTTMRCNTDGSRQTVRENPETTASNSPVTYGKGLALEELPTISFDEEALFTPWLLDPPMQHLESGSSSISGDNSTAALELIPRQSRPPSRSRGPIGASPGQLLDLSRADTAPSSRSPSATDSAADFDTWDESNLPHGDLAWAMDVDAHATAGTSAEPLSLARDKTLPESERCCCLLHSISFLSHLVSQSASREDRIDRLLAEVRHSIETLRLFLECGRCAARAEQNMLLAMAARQIGALCGKTAHCYTVLHRRGHGEHDVSPPTSRRDASAGPVDISVSTYRVNRQERLHLLGSLVRLQMVEVQQSIDTIRSRHRSSHGQTQALLDAEDHIQLAQGTIGRLDDSK